MNINHVITELDRYSRIAHLDNIEEIMKNVDALITSIPEGDYYPVADTVKNYLSILNPIYIEKMKLEGKVVPFSLESLLNHSMN